MHEACGIQEDMDAADTLCFRLDRHPVAYIELYSFRDASGVETRKCLLVNVAGDYLRSSRANATAQARPIPAAAAVTHARLPCNLPGMVLP
jgi:hypothetical protein